MTTAAAVASNPWLPAALDAEFSPQVASLLRTEHGRRELSSRVRRDEGGGGRNEEGLMLRAAVKKHLRALGWSILCRPNAAMVTRFRYKAPHDGKSYASLPDLIVDAAAVSHLVADVDAHHQFQHKHHHLEMTIIPPSDGISREEGDDQEEDDHETSTDEEEDDGPDGVHVIAEYIALMATNDRARGRRANRLRHGAKRQLLAAGWTFWMKLKSNGREELRYKAPTGRSYISLHTACQAFVNTTGRLQLQSPSAAASASVDGGIGTGTGTSTSHCRPSVKKRKLSELMPGDDGAVNVTMKKCTTTIKKKETCCEDGTRQLIKKSITTTTLTRKKKKRRKKATTPTPTQQEARVVLRPNSTASASPRTLLSVLIDKGIVVPRDKVTSNGKDGLVTGEGIRCACCTKPFTVAEFEAHATARAVVMGRDEAWARVFLKKDGRPLSQCLVELMRRDDGAVPAARRTSNGGGGGVRVKEKCSDPEGDSVCSVCSDGGELLLCDHCPSAFHHGCVGLQATPEGDWFCPSCRCGVCGGSDFDDTAKFTDQTIIYCEQCEGEYHVGCVKEDERCRRRQQGGWLCSRECGDVFRHLQGLVAAATIPTRVQGVSLSILRRRRMPCTDAAEHGQLCAALDVLHECFVTLKEPRTQTDLAADMVFNRESDLRRLDFRGYYVVGLEKGGELITVGTLRVLGTAVAELPLVGTRFAHRRQGMCHLLVTELEKLLRQVGVRRLVLPAVPELLPMWTASLGFHPMTHSDMADIAARHAILTFQGTTMCQKNLLPVPA